jgi:3-deoxy-7-phosphoheptulonate synthase
VVLMYSSGVPTVKIGRVAGQFAKPRSQDTERVAGEEVFTYQGDMINGALPADKETRTPNPENMIRAYDQSAATLNLLRGFAKGGFADLASVHEWNREFVRSSSEGRRYEAIASAMSNRLRFTKSISGLVTRRLFLTMRKR